MTYGTLFLVATPIGNLADITQRALQTLAEVDLIAAEDTRHSKPLLQHYAITTPMLSLHQYNEQQRVQQLIDYLQQGKNIALISDAGTPLISDPGFLLVRQAHHEAIKVVPIPGPCAAIAALSASGLPSNKFCFEGFLPAKQSLRKQHLAKLIKQSRTMIFYESTHRLLAALADMVDIFGGDRQAVIAKEISKCFETIIQAPLEQLPDWLKIDPKRQKGEFVIVVSGFDKPLDNQDYAEQCRVLDILLAELPVKQAARIAAELLQQRKNLLYELALERKS